MFPNKGRKTKILILVRDYAPYAHGGLGRVVQHIEKFHHKYGVELTIIANHPVLKVSKEIKNNTVVYRVPMIGSTFLTKVPCFSYFASRLVAQLQESHDLIYSVSSSFFCEIRKPFVFHFQGTRYGEYLACKELKKPVHAFLSKLYVPFDRDLLKSADGVIALSEDMLDEIEAMGGTKVDIGIIPNGVDTNLFRPTKTRCFDATEKKVLYVGRLDARKGMDILLHALKETWERMQARLIVVGSGGEEKRLKNLAQSLAIPVDFSGRIANERLPDLYNDVDLLALPSLYEPFGIVALEAMACGTPAIVSSACPDLGMPRFEKGDVNSLAEMLLEVLPSQQRLQELSRKALEISRDYDWENIVPRIFAFLERFV